MAAGIELALLRGHQPVGLLEHPLESGFLAAAKVFEVMQSAALVCDAQVRDGLLSGALRLEDVLENRELTEQVVHALREEAWQPNQRPASSCLIFVSFEHLDIVVRSEAFVVERIIHDEAPIVMLRAGELIGPELAHVGKPQMTEALGVVPVHGMVAAHVGHLVYSHRIKENVAKDALAGASGVRISELVEDGVDIHTLETERDGRVASGTDFELARSSSPSRRAFGQLRWPPHRARALSRCRDSVARACLLSCS